jgi:hypothetical protein
VAEIINLRRARKAKARADAARQADANRLAFGRTRAEREVATRDADRARRLLDGAKRED